MTKRMTVGGAALFALLFALAPAAPATAAAARQPGVLSEVLEVRVVNLEVVVTDKQGGRVRGLEPGDFRLWIDGKQMPIGYFTEVANGEAAASRQDATAMPATVPGEEVETSYLVFVDDFFSIAQDRDTVLSALSAQLGLLGSRDRMAVVAWDGRHLGMLSSWSSSQPALQRALEQAKARPAFGLQRKVELDSFSRDRDEANARSLGLLRISDPQLPGVDGIHQLDAVEEHYAAQVQEQVERSVGAVASTLRAFATPPGRKVMLLLSGGWPSSSSEWAAGGALLQRPAARRYAEGAELVSPVVQTANLLGYTVYAVDVPGMSREFPGSADQAAPALHPGIDLREQSLHYTLALLAEPTGGKPLLNSARLAALEDVSVDTRSYYWLGFAADRQFDEREHEVRIEVTKPGLRVRHREGYRDFSRQREVTMAVESALLFGGPLTEHSFPVRVGAARRDGIGKVSVPLELDIPVDGVTFLPTAAGWTAALDLRVAVRDDVGGTAPVAVVPLSFTLAQAPAPGTFLHYATSIRMRRDHHEMLVALHDRAAGSLLATQMEIDPR